MSIPSKLLTAGATVPEPSGEVLFTTTGNAGRNAKTDALMNALHPTEVANFSGYRFTHDENDTHLVTNWTVPAGVRVLQVCMVGTGSFKNNNGGDAGSLVHGTLFVAPGQVLELHIPKDIYYRTGIWQYQAWYPINPKIYRDGVLLLDCEGYGVFTDASLIGAGGLGAQGTSYQTATGGGGGGAGGYRGFSGGAGGNRYSAGDIRNGEVPAEGGGGGGGGWEDLGGGVGLWGEGITVSTSWGGTHGSEGYSRNFGGGGAGTEETFAQHSWPLNSGDLPGVGAIRILWGEGREFPSTKVKEEDSWTISLNGLEARPYIKLYQDEGTYTYEMPRDGFLSGVALGGGGGGGGASNYDKTYHSIITPLNIRAAGGGANANFDNLPVKAGDVVTVTIPPRAMGPVDSTDLSFNFVPTDVTAWTTDTLIGNAGGDAVISINGYECRAEGGAAPVARWAAALATAVRAQPIHTNAPAGLVTNGGEGGLGGEGNLQSTGSYTPFEAGGGGGAGGYDGRGGDGADGTVAASGTFGGETGVGALSGAGGCCNAMGNPRLAGVGGPGAEIYGLSRPTLTNTTNGLSTGGGSCPIFGWDITTKYDPDGTINGVSWAKKHYYYHDNTTLTAFGSKIGGGSGLAFTWAPYSATSIPDTGLHGGVGAVGLYFSETTMPAQPFHLTE